MRRLRLRQVQVALSSLSQRPSHAFVIRFVVSSFRATLTFLKDTDKPVRVCVDCHESIQAEAARLERLKEKMNTTNNANSNANNNGAAVAYDVA